MHCAYSGNQCKREISEYFSYIIAANLFCNTFYFYLITLPM